jgi:hypothetical protein
VRLFLLLFLAACSPLSTQVDSSSFRLQPWPAPEPPPARPVWRTSFAEAEAAAKERHVAMLLYFTAKW